MGAGLTVDIYDQGALISASSVSSGIINPVTGPKYVKSWMIEDLLPEARELYSAIEDYLNIPIVHNRQIWRHLKDIKAENIWDSRMEDPSYQRYVRRPDHHKAKLDLFQNAHRFGIVTKGLHLDVRKMITALNLRWKEQEILIKEAFDESQMEIMEDGYQYKKRKYRHVIMAQGHQGASSQLFDTDTYRPVKGEVLLVRIEDLNMEEIVKFGKFIMPLGDNIYWIGSNYQHDFTNSLPDTEQSTDLYAFLDQELGLPYEVVQHQSGIRPATKYRRPLIGEHLKHRGLYLFNGLGTKGISLVPYFSRALIQSIREGGRFESTKAYKDSFHI